MPFVNRVRLPIKLSKPQYTEEREVFRQSNGVIKVLSAIIRKRYEGETDFLPDKLHGRLKVALSHDNVAIEGERYLGGVVQDGEYNIAWPDFMDYPLGKAEFFVFVTPFNVSNTNCGSCEEFSQVVAEDDDLGTLNEGQELDVPVLENDNICCDPIEITFITTNGDYIQGIGINNDNTIHLILKTPLPTATNVVLFTYRVQCENGLYDEANVIANINGSIEPPCESPTNLVLSVSTPDSLTFTWDAPSSPPAQYQYELYDSSNLGVPIQSGVTSDTTILFADLDSETAYRFYLRSECSIDSLSDWQYINAATQPPVVTTTCGRYRVVSPPFAYSTFEYIDCNGNQQLESAFGAPKERCMLESSPGTPVYFAGSWSLVVIKYLGTC